MYVYGSDVERRRTRCTTRRRDGLLNEAEQGIGGWKEHSELPAVSAKSMERTTRRWSEMMHNAVVRVVDECGETLKTSAREVSEDAVVQQDQETED